MASSSTFKLQTADGKLFEATQALVNKSTVLKAAAKLSNKPIFLGIIDSTTVKLMIEWSRIWEGAKSDAKERELQFFKTIEIPNLFALATAANFLNIPNLHVPLCKFIDEEFINYKRTIGYGGLTWKELKELID